MELLKIDANQRNDYYDTILQSAKGARANAANNSFLGMQRQAHALKRLAQIKIRKCALAKNSEHGKSMRKRLD